MESNESAQPDIKIPIEAEMEVDQPAITDILKAIVCATDTQVTILSNDQ